MLESNDKPKQKVKNKPQSSAHNTVFGRRQYYKFIAPYSLEECVSRIQLKQTSKAKVRTPFFGNPFPSDKVDVSIEYSAPNIVNFIILKESPSNSGNFTTKFSGRLERLTGESTSVHGESIEDISYIPALLLTYFLFGGGFVLKGILESNGYIIMGLGLIVLGCIGMLIQYLWRKNTHSQYIESWLTKPLPVHMPRES